MSTLKLLYFAWVRERIGLDEEEIERPASGITVAQVIDRLALTSAGHESAFADRSRLRAALDQSFVQLDAPVGEARELAIFPPVTGG